jgi:tetratricopeptide (TPR) repeat protein
MRSALLTTCLLLSAFYPALPSLGGAQESSAVAEHFALAQQDQQQGLLDAAAHEYQVVLKLQPKLAEAYVNLGLVYYSQAKFEDSARALTAAYQLRPGMRGVTLWLGIDDVKLNRPAQGAALLREAVRIDPNDRVALNWLATSLWDAGQTEAALTQLRSAKTRFPDDPDLLFAFSEAYDKAASQETEQLLEETTGTALYDLIYGTIYFEDRAWQKAQGHLRRAIERDPHAIEALVKLTQVDLEQGDLPAAQESIDQATKLGSQSAALLALRGLLLLLNQQPAAGLASVEQAIKTDRNETLDALGLPMETQDTAGGADAKLQSLCHDASSALESSSADGNAKYVSLAALRALAGDEEGARRFYRQAITGTAAPEAHRYEDEEASLLRWLKAHPGDKTARFHLALIRRQISRSQLRRLLEVAPDSYHVHQMLGQLYASRQEDEKALTEYLAVAAAQPDLPGVHFWLGHLYWKHGDADHAITELNRELQLSPGHAEANGELGTVLVAQDKPEEAIPHLEAAIHSKPDLWPAYAQLGRAYASERNYVRAEQMLSRALPHDQDGSTHYQLALVLRAEGKTTQAAQAFAQVRSIKSERMAPAPTDDAQNEGGKQ